MLPILAQANPPPDGVIFAIVAFVCGFYLVLLVIFIFFLLTLQRALARCHPDSRIMEPGMVWLNLIPLFHIVWMFITVVRIAESLRNEFGYRGWHRRGDDYGQGIGIATCALALAANIPYIGCIFGIAWLVCFILYWMRISGYSNQLAARTGDADEYDDDDDDRDDDDDDRREGRPWDRGR